MLYPYARKHDAGRTVNIFHGRQFDLKVWDLPRRDAFFADGLTADLRFSFSSLPLLFSSPTSVVAYAESVRLIAPGWFEPFALHRVPLFYNLRTLWTLFRLKLSPSKRIEFVEP